jgi:hypothetical protein
MLITPSYLTITRINRGTKAGTLPQHGMQHQSKQFHGRKVTTVNAKDVQYMECEVIDNSSHIKQLACHIKELSTKPRPDKRKIKKLRQQMETERKSKVFHLEPITTTTAVKCSVNRETPPLTFKTKMTQFPINLADTVTGHKLQGRTLDKIIITGWGHSKTGNTQSYHEWEQELVYFYWKNSIWINHTVQTKNSEDSSNVSKG